MTRTTCKISKCRKWKNLNDNGFCPDHTSANHTDEQEICKCNTCSLVVNDNDFAINCELCNEWCHISCTTIGQTLYELIDPEEGDPPVGFQWFCDTCLPIIDNLKKAHKNRRDVGLQHVSTSAQFDSHRTPICEDYRHGVCGHGISGKKAVGDKMSCTFRHPKKCEKYCKYGINSSYGCINPECKFLHPILCRYSIRHNYCENEKCTYTHLKGTKRNKVTPPSDRNQSRYHQQRHSQKTQFYSKSDGLLNLGFHDYPTSKRYSRLSSGKNKNHLNSVNRSQDFRYQDRDFPPFEPVQLVPSSEPNAYHQMNNPGPNLSNQTDAEGQHHFLELLQVVKAVQESQKNFQAQLHAMKMMISPPLPPQQQLQFTQPQNQQYPSQIYSSQTLPQNLQPQSTQPQSAMM